MKIFCVLILIFIVNALQSGQAFAQSKSDTSDQHSFVDPVEISPQFPGGQNALLRFIKSNIHYVKGAEGKKVFIRFIVEANGSLSNLEIARGLNKDADKEALRILRISPKWQPGIQNGSPYRVAYTLPIKFPVN